MMQVYNCAGARPWSVGSSKSGTLSVLASDDERLLSSPRRQIATAEGALVSMRAARVSMMGGGADACPPAVTPRKTLISSLMHAQMGLMQRPLFLGFGCLVVAGLLLYGHISTRRQLVYSTNSRLTSRAFSGALGTSDCIPADVMIGGELGPNGNGTLSKRRRKKIAAL